MEEVLGKEEFKRLIAQAHTLMKPNGQVVMYEYKGVPFPDVLCQPDVLDLFQTWKARPEDIFITTYPKAGTTWMQEVVSALVRAGDLEKLNQSHTTGRVPFIEATLLPPGAPRTPEIVDKMSSPRTIKTHLPGHIFPPDALKQKSRIVYVARNPKDVCVSFYHFCIMYPGLPTPTSWEMFFEDFITGKVPFGPWWDHYLFYWNLRHDPNVLFIRFEDMKTDLKANVQKVGTFLGYSYSDDVIDKIVDHCTFASMKKNPMTNPDSFIKHFEKEKTTSETRHHEKTSFMRKGKVGDWKCHLTVAQNERLEAQIEDKLSGSGLIFDY